MYSWLLPDFAQLLLFHATITFYLLSYGRRRTLVCCRPSLPAYLCCWAEGVTGSESQWSQFLPHRRISLLCSQLPVVCCDWTVLLSLHSGLWQWRGLRLFCCWGLPWRVFEIKWLSCMPVLYACVPKHSTDSPHPPTAGSAEAPQVTVSHLTGLFF